MQSKKEACVWSSCLQGPARLALPHQNIKTCLIGCVASSRFLLLFGPWPPMQYNLENRAETSQWLRRLGIIQILRLIQISLIEIPRSWERPGNLHLQRTPRVTLLHVIFKNHRSGWFLRTFPTEAQSLWVYMENTRRPSLILRYCDSRRVAEGMDSSVGVQGDRVETRGLPREASLCPYKWCSVCVRWWALHL